MVFPSLDPAIADAFDAVRKTFRVVPLDAMSRDEGRRSFLAISFVQVVILRKGDTGKWIEQLTPQLLRIGSSAPWS